MVTVKNMMTIIGKIWRDKNEWKISWNTKWRQRMLSIYFFIGLTIFAMPIMGGIILVTGKDGEKPIGAVLLAVGIILWIIMGTSS